VDRLKHSSYSWISGNRRWRASLHLRCLDNDNEASRRLYNCPLVANAGGQTMPTATSRVTRATRRGRATSIARGRRSGSPVDAEGAAACANFRCRRASRASIGAGAAAADDQLMGDVNCSGLGIRLMRC
jgi:hypothetical protein